MANEIIFNLDLDASQNVSSFTFRNGMDGIFYYRPYSGSYLSNWSTVSTIRINYAERNSPTNSYTLTLTSADIVNVNGEDLMKVTLPSAMMNHSAVYDGTIRINNSASKTILTSILVYDVATIEISLMRSLIIDYEDSLYNYLKAVKKDKLNTANGVAILDSKRIVLEDYLPASYKQHIDSKIRIAEVHKIKLDEQGIMWYFDSDNNTWKQGKGQNGSAGHIPPTLTIQDGMVIIKHDPSTVVVLQKYDEGQKDIAYFVRNGKNISGSSFAISKYGTYTYYYKTSGGYENVVAIVVKETDIPFPSPSYTVTEGLVKIFHKDNSKIKLQKWASGSRSVSYFDSQGTEIINDSFLVDSSGQYTLYYELLDGRKFVTPIIISEDNLPIDIPPTINKKNGIITLTFDPKMSIEISKWDEGVRTVEYFRTAGNVIVNNTFKVAKAGEYTIYYKTVRGKENALIITVSQEELKPDPLVRFEITKGEVTVIYPDYIFPQSNKWETGSRDIIYFQDRGNVFVGNKFTVTQAGQHTLYFKDQDDMEYVRLFTVKITDLPPNIKPSYSKMNGKIIISVENKSLYDQSRFIIGLANIEDFRNGAGENVANWEIPITVKGNYIHYYRVLDGQDGLEEIVITDDDLPHNEPSISIKNGLAIVTHSQPSGVLVLAQKWDIGIKTIDYFSDRGNIITDNKFYVLQAGEHTLYYKLSNGGEYILKFTVKESELEKPQSPATITVVRGEATVIYPAETIINIQKWTAGKDVAISYFQNNGNIFTGNKFTIEEIGWYTLYYKLENEKEYTQSFEVKTSNISPEFIDPTITIIRGLATISYDSSMDVTMTKWEYGINTVQYFETGGNIVSNNKFTVTQAGTHTLYTVLENKYKYLSTFEVAEDQLPKQDRPPVINTVEGVVTITHDSQTQVDIQKWAVGNRDVTYFQSEGTVFMGNTFNVSIKGEYTYYYRNIHGDEYVYSFVITEDNLPFYPPIIQVFDALLTIEFTSPYPVTINKIDTGIRDKNYFASNGNNIVDGRYPIIAAGEYTIYWRENNGNDYINIFTVTESQIQYHQIPKILVNNKNVSVEFTQDVETFVSEKKYGAGDQAIEWFNNNGIILESNSFALADYGKYTYYYKYRNRGYILSFTAIDLSHLVPLSSIELEKEFIFGGRVWTKLANTIDTTIIADETPYIQSGIFGASSTINPEENGSIGNQLLSLYANPSNYRLDEFNSILTKQWSNGTISNPTEKQYQSKVGMKNYQEAVNSRIRLSDKGLTGEYWTSTYSDNINAYAENITSKTSTPYSVSNSKHIRGMLHVEKDALVEKVPLVSIQNGMVTIIDPDNPPIP